MNDMFHDDDDYTCPAMQSALAAADAKQLQREAHTVKGLLATFSDEAGAGLALRLEKEAKDGNLAAGANLLPQIMARMHEVGSVLQSLSAR